MRGAFSIVFLWALAVAAFGASEITASRTVGRYRVTVTSAPIDARRDALGRNRDGSATLHGGVPYGTDGALPRRVVRSVTLTVGSQRYCLPEELFRDLADPHVGPDFIPRTFTVSQTWRELIVILSGGDGAGGYQCRWRILKSRLEVSRSMQRVPASTFSPDAPAQKLIPLASPAAP